MQPEIPAVLVEAYILQARNLPRKNAAGQSDTFCLVEATGSPQKYRTNVVTGTLHPVWNESFQVKVRDPPTQMITVKIWAEKKDGNHDFVGVVVVPVSRIESGAQCTEEGWYEIRGERNDVLEGPDGMSKVELSFVYKKATPNEQQVSGFMFKKADNSEEWIKRFAILDPCRTAYSQLLQFYESPKGVVDNAAFLSEEVNTRTCKVEVMDVAEIPAAERKTSYAFKLVTNFHNLVGQVNTQEERNTWVEALRHVGNPPGIRFLPPPPSREKRPQSGTLQREQSSRMDDPPPTRTPPSVTAGDRDIKIANPLQDAPNSATHAASDSEGLWQKKFDATRRALADQVAQNQDLQAQIAELESGKNAAQNAARESSELRSALERSEASLNKEKQRNQELQEDLQQAKLAQGPGNTEAAERRARAATEGYEAKIAALESEKRQMQGELEHLRRALEKSQEKVALLQIQDSNADLSQELKKQLEDAHRSMAEVKQKHLRSEQSRMAAEAEAQELRAALENNPQHLHSSQQEQLMLGLKQQVGELTKRLEGLGPVNNSGAYVSASYTSMPRSRSPETVTPARPMQGSLPVSTPRGRNTKARELCADITSTLSSRRHPTRSSRDARSSDYIPGTNLDRASLSPPPRVLKESPRVPLVISPDDPNLM